MNNIIMEKTKQVKSVEELLKNSLISSDGYDSTKEAFFENDNTNKGLEKIYDKDLPEYPESLNRHIKIMYEIIGNPEAEIYIGEWTIMTLNRSLEQYKDYCDNNQRGVFDIGFTYCGMGHIMVISCDLNNHLLFKRRDGGSNGYEREDNYKKILKYNPDEYNHIYFTQWKNELLSNSNDTFG